MKVFTSSGFALLQMLIFVAADIFPTDIADKFGAKVHAFCAACKNITQTYVESLYPINHTRGCFSFDYFLLLLVILFWVTNLKRFMFRNKCGGTGGVLFNCTETVKMLSFD